MPRKNLVLFLAVLFASAMGISRAFSEDKYYREMQTFSRILHHVMQNYVTEVEPKDLFEGAYSGMLNRLDPYTQYLNMSDTKSFSEDTEGKFGGLGIEITIENGVLMVISPIRGTPAFEAGIQAGDRVLKIDGKSTERISLVEAVHYLRGEVGSKVVVTVRHTGSMVDEDITITRAVIKPASVEYEIIDQAAGIALVRIPSFNARVMDDLSKGVETMKKANLRGMILDLRQNPGGLLNVAVEMCDQFVADGVIVSVKGRHEVLQQAFKAKKGDALEDVPLVVLVDGSSASASEIVAGCIRDHKRGMLVGARTYGKGSVQNVVPLNKTEMLKLTTARYYTPADLPINDRHGIMPDVLVPMPREHLFALRNQEREDKLRGRYHLGGSIEEEETPVMEKKKGQEGEPEKTKGTENEKNKKKKVRRSRVVDYQLKAALNILKWQQNGAGK